MFGRLLFVNNQIIINAKADPATTTTYIFSTPIQLENTVDEIQVGELTTSVQNSSVTKYNTGETVVSPVGVTTETINLDFSTLKDVHLMKYQTGTATGTTTITFTNLVPRLVRFILNHPNTAVTRTYSLPSGKILATDGNAVRTVACVGHTTATRRTILDVFYDGENLFYTIGKFGA